MQHRAWLFALSLAAAVGLWAFQSQTPQSAGRNNWEYAVVENWGHVSGSSSVEEDRVRREYRERAVICYMQESGCQILQVELIAAYVDERNKENPNHVGDAQQAAAAKAIALLGSDGWELAGSGPALTWHQDPNQAAAPIAPALYFKRLKR
jgi:hypothetical protein